MRNDDGTGQPRLAQLAGASLDARCVLVRPVVEGDVDLDGRVDAADYYLVDRAHALGIDGGWLGGDLSCDGGPPDADDYLALDASFIRAVASGLAAEPTAAPRQHATPFFSPAAPPSSEPTADDDDPALPAIWGDGPALF